MADPTEPRPLALLPPELDDDTYRRNLGRADFWLGYARRALDEAGLATEELTIGFPGTYPVLVGSTVVIKLFGFFGDWRSSLAAEIAANTALDAWPEVLRPRLLAAGRLFPDRSDDWPYLIMERIPGEPWRLLSTTNPRRPAGAAAVGAQLRALHDRPAPTDPALRDDEVVRDAAAALARQRQWGSLPSRLLDGLEDFLLATVICASSLVHGDVTEDHIFLGPDGYTGLIDWGDALVADPHYDFGALALGAFAADLDLFGSFLQGYGEQSGPHLARHCLQLALRHRFDLFASLRHVTESAPDLDSLATRLFDPS